MKEYEVTCVNKPDRSSAHEHITHIGNIAGQWRLTRELAIQKIDSREEAFYTVDKSSRKKVYVSIVFAIREHDNVEDSWQLRSRNYAYVKATEANKVVLQTRQAQRRA